MAQISKILKKTKISQTDRDALTVMELNDDVKWEQIHSKFKELVKNIILIKIKAIRNLKVN